MQRVNKNNDKDKRISIRVDPELKEESQELFKSMGMDLSTAITIFLKQSLTDNALPFKPRADNFENIKAKKEVEDGNLKKFNTIEALWNDLND
ncbi:type II toxin-antitoxin system RelB/DinJ family antitoxin [Companilactobacillus sp. HBUAS59699]|uniref:type II toxin-antitoxin system RelB/DinJ family antitoxin n=1 Tax=Companilactobacillus sp. HBUAS59699 TaxID=3109358 RepID=UPI002FF3324C